jgi:ABC-type dipeptide/oligopeptide/nickel transport system permease component
MIRLLFRRGLGIGVLWLVATSPSRPARASVVRSIPKTVAPEVGERRSQVPSGRTDVSVCAYLAGVARGDLGPSFKYLGRDVATILAETFPVSFGLGAMALTVAVVLGLGLGVAAGHRPDGWIDRGAMVLATAGVALPNFVLGVALVLVVSHQLHWLPPALWEGPRSGAPAHLGSRPRRISRG